MHGYFEMPEETAKAIDAEGWLHSGDLCSMDERGYVRVHGRLKDMIIRGGENIYPKEIEDVLFTHPSVAEVAVIGVPDREWGEQVAAFVRTAPGARASRRERAQRPGARASRALQDAAPLAFRRGVSAQRVGEDPEDRAARALVETT